LVRFLGRAKALTHRVSRGAGPQATLKNYKKKLKGVTLEQTY